MKIESSAVSMSSSHSQYTHFEQHSETLITTADKAATLELSDESKTLVEQLKERKAEDAKKVKEQAAESEKKNLAFLLSEQSKTKKAGGGLEAESPKDARLEAMKRMLELLNEMRKGKHFSRQALRSQVKSIENDMKGMPMGNADASGALAFGMTENGSAEKSSKIGGSLTNVVSTPQRTWKKITVTSAFYTEVENTAYRTQGMVKTADGRELSFNIDVEMSRAFCDKYENYMEESYVCVDPLVINLDSNIGSVSDQKFMFDLDSDGKEEKISFAGKGSGFLALDKNNDGKINDGSELFGTKSGDGFRDLAAYDKDGNGWIDENDEVFNDLRIWMKNEQGEDMLLSLKEADVGAIYLGKASTEFSLKNDETHEANGFIRSTGVYLKESGGAGTVQHIDLAV